MDPFVLVSVIAIMVWSITTHEVAHGWVAYKLGDDTSRLLGRLTLNPIPHVDPFLTIILPAVLFISGAPILGGARPIPVDPRNLRNMRRDMAVIAAAGPLSNFLIAFVLVGVLAAFLSTGFWGADSQGVTVLSLGVFLNIVLGVFNLMPIPPLDGSKVVAIFLRGRAEMAWWQFQRFGIFLLLGLLFLNREFLIGVIFGPSEYLLFLFGDVFGIRREMVEAINAAW
jgi:Zn-dependent protease